MYAPENRESGSKRIISFPVVILRTLEEEPAEDPIVIAGGGGPGGTVGLEPSDMVPLWEAYEWVGSDQGRDVILVEQRGVGRAVPSLACPEIIEAGLLDISSLLESDRATSFWLRAAKECRDRLVGLGIDLGAYNTREAAADLDELRRALGYAEWNLWGISYGTRLVLTVLRDFPGGVRSAVLDSPVPIEVNEYEEAARNTQRALDKLFAGCTADEHCAADFPDLEWKYDELQKRLASAPIVLKVSHPRTLAPTPIVVDDSRFSELVLFGLYSRSSISEIPKMVYSLSMGSEDLAAPFARDLLEFYLSIGWSDGLHYSTMCGDEAPFNNFELASKRARLIERGAELEILSLEMAQALCEMWHVEEPVAKESVPVESDVPTLIMVGEYDPVTPPSWARLIDRRLANSHLFELKGYAHSVFSESSCVDVLMIDFLDNPSVAPLDDCLAEVAGLTFSVLP